MTQLKILKIISSKSWVHQVRMSRESIEVSITYIFKYLHIWSLYKAVIYFYRNLNTLRPYACEKKDIPLLNKLLLSICILNTSHSFRSVGSRLVFSGFGQVWFTKIYCSHNIQWKSEHTDNSFTSICPLARFWLQRNWNCRHI